MYLNPGELSGIAWACVKDTRKRESKSRHGLPDCRHIDLSQRRMTHGNRSCAVSELLPQKNRAIFVGLSFQNRHGPGKTFDTRTISIATMKKLTDRHLTEHCPTGKFAMTP
jgi:hypothetical protein